MKSYVEDLIRKYVCIVIFASIFLLTTTLLFVSAYNEKHKITYASVGEISITGTPKKGEQTEIHLIGALCCPCFELHSHEVKIDDYKREVNIKLWKIKVYGGCAQVVVPFDYIIHIQFPLSGNWTIFCNNKINTSIIIEN